MPVEQFLQPGVSLNELPHWKSLGRELQWLQQVLDARIRDYFAQDPAVPLPSEVPVPHHEAETVFGQWIDHNGLSETQRLIVMLALVPEIQPQVLDVLFIKNSVFDRCHTEFGGVFGKNHNGFLPTIETAIFLLAGDDIELRLKVKGLFAEEEKLRKNWIIEDTRRTDSDSACLEPEASQQLMLTAEVKSLLLSGMAQCPSASKNFPAKLLNSPLTEEDLILSVETWQQLEELTLWLKNGDLLLQNKSYKRLLKGGYRALFYGPPGTGKSLTAALIAKKTQRNVYRIDLSQLVSKYIGETEKNLERLFLEAERKDWILFFDEADALLGKRTEISSSNDRYANQNTAYLLQRLEDCPNVVIMASNLKQNFDEAYTRRFQSVVYFPIPNQDQRLELWNKYLSVANWHSADLDLESVAKKYPLSGGSISNVARYVALVQCRNKDYKISINDVLAGVRKELEKEGRTL